jgi:predicted nuclease of restriction endonuclease-like RecB superfamily
LEVDVELLQGELNNQDSLRLEGFKMRCSLPEGVIMIPESDIGNCKGELKEGLQELIIEKLYTYIVQNLGRLNLEVIDIPQSSRYS